MCKTEWVSTKAAKLTLSFLIGVASRKFGSVTIEAAFTALVGDWETE